MEPFLRVTGRAAPLQAANIDTDVIMPKQFLKGVDRSGLARGVFHDLRTRPDGSPEPGFILNQPAWCNSVFLAVGPNFGCGSSREHAVWGLVQLGIRALLGTSYAGIFFDNCSRNGVLALSLPAEHMQRIFKAANSEARNVLSIDLPEQSIQIDDEPAIRFELAAPLKEALISGIDPVGLTLRFKNEIEAFESEYQRGRPWLQTPLG